MNKTLNSKLTKRAIVLRMYIRAFETQKNSHAFSYMMRRVGLNEAKTKSLLNWMKENTIVDFKIVGRNFVFCL